MPKYRQNEGRSLEGPKRAVYVAREPAVLMLKGRVIRRKVHSGARVHQLAGCIRHHSEMRYLQPKVGDLRSHTFPSHGYSMPLTSVAETLAFHSTVSTRK